MAPSYSVRIGTVAFTAFLIAEGIAYLVCWRAFGPLHFSASPGQFAAALIGTLVSSLLHAVLLNCAISIFMRKSVADLHYQMRSFVESGLKDWPSPLLGQIGGTQPVEGFRSLTRAAEQMAMALKKAEQQLRAQERQHLEWLAFLAHDLGTPVARIMARLRTMDTDAADDPQRMKQLLEHAELEVGQLAELIGWISQLAVLESGIERKFVTVPLDAILTQLVEDFEFEASCKEIELDLRIVPGIGPVRIERYLIKRCIENLISNALSQTPNGGLISVRAERVGSDAQILVSDTGRGIAPEILPHVFDFAFRGPGQRPARVGVHGLGLAFVKRVAEIHQGCVHAGNRAGSGAEFMLMLPLESSASAQRGSRA
jgi:signal transduction histidine kinase